MNRLFLSAGLVLAVIPAQATNISFMPGDAFFHSRLTKEVADAIPEEGGTITLKYTRPDHAQFNGCGYSGFVTLEVHNVPPDIARALKELRAELHADYGTDYRVTVDSDGKETGRYEVDPPRLFVYPKDFEPAGDDFGLKYNEKWNDPPAEAQEPSSQSPAIMYECFVKGEKAVVRDWMYGHKMPALSVTIPDGVHWGTSGKPIEQPVQIDAADVRFFVLNGGDLRDYFLEKRGSRYWEITPEGFRVSEYTKRSLLSIRVVPFDKVERAVDYNLFDEEAEAEDVSTIAPADAWLTQ